MAEDWKKTQQDVYADLQKEGLPLVFTRQGKGTYDPIAGQYDPGEVQSFETVGLFQRITQTTAKSNFIWQADGAIKEGDKMLMLACGTYTPELEDTITFGTTTWAVKSWSNLEPGGVDLLMYVLIRKA